MEWPNIYSLKQWKSNHIFPYLNKFKTQCKSKRKRERSEKKQQKARNNAIHDGNMYATLTFFFFFCKNDALHLKLGDGCFCPGKCNEGWGQGPNRISKSSGRWNQKRSSWGGLTQAMIKAVILPIPQMQESWLSRQKLSYLLNYYSIP